MARLAGVDLILVLGGALSNYHVEGTGSHIPDGARLFLLIDNPAIAAWAPVGTAIVTNLKEGITALLDAPAPIRRRAPPVRQKPPRLDEGAFTDAHLFEQLAALRSEDSIVVEEAPGSRSAMHAYLPITRRDGFYTCASGGLGHGLPAAIGIALARPDEKVIALLGDGSSMYAIQGLWTAAQLNLPISFIIVKNRRYEALYQFGRHFGMDRTIGTELPDIDFCALARGQGVNAFHAADRTQLNVALAASFAAAGPSLVEVEVA